MTVALAFSFYPKKASARQQLMWDMQETDGGFDLKQMVADKGYAHLNGIKGPTYDTTVTVAKMLLYKDTASGIDAVTVSSSGGSRYPEGIIYDLSGKQAAHLRPGINVVGGKKVLIK